MPINNVPAAGLPTAPGRPLTPHGIAEIAVFGGISAPAGVRIAAYPHRPEGEAMSVEHTIRSYIEDEIMRGRDDQTALELDYPLIEERVLDSMDVQRLVAFIETRFEVRIPDEY